MRILLIGLPLMMSCGDSGKDGTGDSSGTGPTANQSPIANAGTDQTIPADQTVTLSGASSTDPDGDALTYLWAFDRVPTGSTVPAREAPFTVNHAGDPVTSFRPDLEGTYIVALTVRDARGALSAPDYVIINAQAPSSLPVANAGLDGAGRVGAEVHLDGSHSYDPHGAVLTYNWLIVDKPADSSVSALVASTTATPSFIPDVKGPYTMSLTVNNGLASSVPDPVTITVTADDHEPVANAGPDQNSLEDCNTVNLDCSASSDPDNDALTYYWSVQLKPDASLVNDATFSDRASATPTFYPDQAGTYVLSCAVYDGSHWSVPDTVHLVAAERSHNESPIVNAGRDQEVNAGSATCTQSGYTYNCEQCPDQTLALGSDGSVTDADSDPLNIVWTLIDGDATITDTHSVTTQVTLQNAEPEQPGECTSTEYRFELQATDCTGAVVTDRVTYTVSCCGVADTSSAMR